MKRTLLLAFSSCLLSLSGYSQLSTGLVAHWKMNGNASDSSGHGHHGHMHNVTPAVGVNGLAANGYYFNGIDSWISVPYDTGFNLSRFSIAAIVKVQGYYNGTCQGNIIFTKGKTGANYGSYALMMMDNPYDNDCSRFDSTKEVFCPTIGNVAPVSTTDLDYTPYIVSNRWYSVVVTYNDTVFKTYVNGVLKNTTVKANSTDIIGTNMDSASIGYNVFETAYPYPFKGVIDDIRIYNRALSATDVYTYGTLDIDDKALTNENFEMYPNPTNGTLHLGFNNDQVKYTVRVTDISGKTLLIDENPMNNDLNVAHLPSGMYLLNIVSANGVINKQFIKE